jgi:hypothetical protein
VFRTDARAWLRAVVVVGLVAAMGAGVQHLREAGLRDLGPGRWVDQRGYNMHNTRRNDQDGFGPQTLYACSHKN